MAHDLVSNASRQVDMRDVEPQSGYDHKQTLNKDKLNSVRGGADNAQDGDLRSVRSEIDYSQKKKFTDMLGEPNRAAQLARLQ